MASPSSSLSTLRPDIAGSMEEFDLAMHMRGFVGHMALPVFEVQSQAGTWGKIPVEDLLVDRETSRAPGGGYNRGSYEFTTDSYTCEEHGLEEPVDDREARMYAEYFDAELVSARRAQSGVLRAAEKRIVDLLFNATTFSATSITNEWDDYANATPVADVEASCQRVYSNCGVYPNALIINGNVFRNLKRTDDVVDRLKYSGLDDPKNVTKNMLAALFNLRYIIVAGEARNSADEGQTATLTPIWSGEYAMTAVVAETNDIREPCIGRTFHWGEDGSMVGGMVESYRDETVRSDIVRTRHDVHEKLIYTECADLMDNITT